MRKRIAIWNNGSSRTTRLRVLLFQLPYTWTAAAIQALFTIVIVYIWRVVPVPGIAVGLLGVAAIFMAVRAEHFTRIEQILWISIAVGLFSAEMRAIRNERIIAQSQFRSTVEHMESLLREEEQVLKYSTGGDEFCYLAAMPPLSALYKVPPGKWPIFIGNSGDVPAPSCDLQVREIPRSGDTAEQAFRKMKETTTLHLLSVPRGGETTNYFISPAPLYQVIIHMPNRDYIEDLTFSPNPATNSGYYSSWKVWRTLDYNKGRPVLDSSRPKNVAQ